MSYNIIAAKLIDGECSISAKILKKLNERFNGDLPEINFIDEYIDNIENEEEDVIIEDVSWCGTWSGNSFRLYTNTILPKLKGWAKIRVVWEDGEIFNITLKDGKVEVDEQ